MKLANSWKRRRVRGMVWQQLLFFFLLALAASGVHSENAPDE
jgi:hypothetical protein